MQQKMVDIIIIRGAPGSGKSSTAKCLAKHYPKGARVEIDNIRSMVISVDWTNQDEHIAILDLSTRTVVDFLNLGIRPVIVVDTFSGDKIKGFISKLKKFDNDLKIQVFALYATENELERRISIRKPEEFRDLAVCIKLNSDTLKHIVDEEIQLNTTGLSPEETAIMLLNSLRYD